MLIFSSIGVYKKILWYHWILILLHANFGEEILSVLAKRYISYAVYDEIPKATKEKMS